MMVDPVVTTAQASSLGIPSNPGLDALQAKIAAHGQRNAEWMAYRDNAFTPMDNAHVDGRRAIGERHTTATYLSKAGEQVSLSTQDWSLDAARAFAAEPLTGAPDFLAVMRELVGIHEQREREYEALRVRLDAETIETRHEELLETMCEFASAVVHHASATQAELLAKLAFVVANDWWDMPGSEAGIRADVTRLAGETVQ